MPFQALCIISWPPVNSTKVTVRKRPIRVKIRNLWSRVTLKFDGWPWKTIEHSFHATSSFVHHFTTIDEFKLELQTGNAQFGSKSAIFGPVWPRSLMNDLEKQQSTSSMLLQALCIMSQPSVNLNWDTVRKCSNWDKLFLPLWPWP